MVLLAGCGSDPDTPPAAQRAAADLPSGNRSILDLRRQGEHSDPPRTSTPAAQPIAASPAAPATGPAVRTCGPLPVQRARCGTVPIDVSGAPTRA